MGNTTARKLANNTSETVPSQTEDIVFDAKIPKKDFYPQKKENKVLINLKQYNIY